MLDELQQLAGLPVGVVAASVATKRKFVAPTERITFADVRPAFTPRLKPEKKAKP